MLVFSAFFSGVETALFSASRDQVLHLKSNHTSSRRLLEILDQNPSGILASILFGNLTINILFFCVSASFSYRLSDYYKSDLDAFVGILVLIMIIIFGEIIPKAIGMTFSNSIIRFSSKVIYFWYLFLGPLRTILEKLINLITPNDDINSALSPDELKVLIDFVKEDNDFGIQEKTMVEKIITLPEAKVREIMIPREKQHFYNSEDMISNVIITDQESTNNYFPVYSNEIDNLVGYFDLQDFFLSKESIKKISDIIKPITFFPETLSSDLMLKNFIENNLNIVGIVDEYGGIAGVLTIDQFLQRILGASESKQSSVIEVLGNNKYQLNGELNIREWKSLFTGFISNDLIDNLTFDTVGGLVMSLLNKVPSEGEKTYLGNLCFTVQKMNENRIELIMIELSSDFKVDL